MHDNNASLLMDSDPDSVPESARKHQQELMAEEVFNRRFPLEEPLRTNCWLNRASRTSLSTGAVNTNLVQSGILPAVERARSCASPASTSGALKLFEQ